MRKRPPPDEQASLFADAERGAARQSARAKAPAKADHAAARQWKMPEREGRTVAEIRLRWPRRLTPAQVARVEAQLGALPQALTKLGFGTVQVERAFVRRRRT
jgi:hypothetical protein